MIKNKPELLAPVGSLDAFYAAVQSGADAVYLGIGSFHARAFSQKISLPELKTCVEYAHLYSVRVYLTLNTLLSENEIMDALKTAVDAYSCGIDAVIVQDFGLAKLLHSQIPDLPLHASTQMNIFSPEMITWAGEHNFERIVLPRELSIDSIQQRVRLAKDHGLEIEVFIHGALCMCYSGLCLFSVLHTGTLGHRSGNKGTCSQPCRLFYDLISKDGNILKKGRLLSPKDRWSVPLLRNLIEAGVHSFKIEGRMKDAEYVRLVVSSYRILIDEICNHETLANMEMVEEQLLLAFNRGGNFTTRYLSDMKNENFLSGDYPGKSGIRLGTLIQKKEKNGSLIFHLEKESMPVRGDVISIRRNDKEICSFPIGKIQKNGDFLEIKGFHPANFSELNHNDVAFQMTGKKFLLHLPQKIKKTPISFELQIKNKQLIIQVYILSGMHKGKSIELNFLLPEEIFPLLSIGRVKEQLHKTGNSPFEVVKIDIHSDMFYVPVSFINEVRRSCIEALTMKMQNPPRSMPIQKTVNQAENNESRYYEYSEQLHVHYDDLSQIDDLSCQADIYSFTVSDVLDNDEFIRILSLARIEPDAQFWLWIPGAFLDAFRTEIIQAEEKLDKNLGARYVGVIGTDCCFRMKGKQIRLSHEFNISNHFAFDSLCSENPKAIALSNELTEEQVIALVKNLSVTSRNTFITLHRYGRIPLMQTEFCLGYGIGEGCIKSQAVYLHSSNSEKDIFPVLIDSRFCTSKIMSKPLNSVSQNVIDVCREYKQPITHLVRFLNESKSIRQTIIQTIWWKD